MRHLARAQTAYRRLNARALEVLERGGILVSCSCSGALRADDLLRTLSLAARDAARDVTLLHMGQQGLDHPIAGRVPGGALPEVCRAEGDLMQPLSELPASVAGALEGVVFDVDDTLTTHGRLHADAFEALWALHRAGLKLVAVTGRPLGWADAMASTWPIDLAVGENGAGWVHRDGRALAFGFFDDAAARGRQAALLERVREAVARELPHVKTASDQPGRRCDLAFDVSEAVALPADDVARLVALIEEHGARALVSSVHAHVIPGAWDKAKGVARAIPEALDVPLDRQRWLFVGDSGNDAAAFDFFELTVGVANVREHLARLSTAPRWVTRAARGEGFAELSAHLLEGRRA